MLRIVSRYGGVAFIQAIIISGSGCLLRRGPRSRGIYRRMDESVQNSTSIDELAACDRHSC
jgi:hypothetical protein